MNLDLDSDNARALLASLRASTACRPELPRAPEISPGFIRFATAAARAISAVDRRQQGLLEEVVTLIEDTERQLSDAITTDSHMGYSLERLEA